MRRLRSLSEAECYLRCYGARADDSVRVLWDARVGRRRRLAGEEIRRLFTYRPDRRPAEAA